MEAIDFKLDVLSRYGRPYLKAVVDDKESVHPLRGDAEKAIWNVVGRLGRERGLGPAAVQQIYISRLPALRKKVQQILAYDMPDYFNIKTLDQNDAVAEFRKRQALGGKLSGVLEALVNLKEGNALLVEELTTSDVSMLRTSIRRYLEDAFVVETTRVETNKDRYLALAYRKAQAAS